MEHAPEDLPRARNHDRVAQPALRTRGRIRPVLFFALFVTITVITVIVVIVVDTISFNERNHVPNKKEKDKMKRANVYQQDQFAGVLEAREDGSYAFVYAPNYRGEPVSLTMPVSQQVWEFMNFPAPFEGLLPEGVQLDGLLRIRKLDRSDLFGQLLAVGKDVVGSLCIEEAK